MLEGVVLFAGPDCWESNPQNEGSLAWMHRHDFVVLVHLFGASCNVGARSGMYQYTVCTKCSRCAVDASPAWRLVNLTWKHEDKDLNGDGVAAGAAL